MKNCINMFLIMFKIGLFTFGGGYAMLALLENEFVAKRKWLTSEEFLDMVAIAESTPGPIAINCATHLGYKRYGVLGSAFSTLGVCMPSFIIIYIISLFFDQFLSLEFVGYAFKGIQVCVIYLILSAGIKMFKEIKKNFISISIMSLTLILMVVFALFSVKFSTIFYILISGIIGVFVYLINNIVKKEKSEK